MSRSGKPSYMTNAMWFAWLLRGDVRKQCLTVCPNGPKAFVAWWILFGRAEYPLVWTFGRRQIKAAMEGIVVKGNVRAPLLLVVLWNSRPDLQANFPFDTEADVVRFMCWYRLEAPSEYPYAPPLPSFAESSISEQFAGILLDGSPGLSWLAVHFWIKHPELQRAFDLTKPSAQSSYSSWFDKFGQDRLPVFIDCAKARFLSPVRSLYGIHPGVNLIGFVHAEFGLGEDVRTLSRALESVSYPHVIVDAGSPIGVRAQDTSRSGFLSPSLNFPISVFCMSAFDAAELYLKRGEAMFAASHNIGYWAWELPRFPPQWAAVAGLVDEIWAATTFQQVAYSSVVARPVVTMPPSVHVSRQNRGPLSGKRVFTFIYPFDPRSFLSRKNPHSLIAAFRRSFRRRDLGVRLTLRVNGDPSSTPGWRAIKASMRGDARIRVVSGTLERSEALRYLSDSDCLVSTHRAEGFGRNIAEALAMGTQVLATGYSGSSDFLERRERLPYRLKKVAADEYPFGSGQLWAEPLIGELTKLLRCRRQKVPSLFANRARARRLMSIYSPENSAMRFVDRLTLVTESLCRKRGRT